MANFKNLDVFKLALALNRMVYTETAAFPRQEMYGLTSQMRRASIGVLSNIAEGEGRLTPGEWRQMLSHARGSLFEVEAQVLAAADLGYLTSEAAEKLQRQIRRTGKALVNFIRFVQRQEAAKRSQPRNPETPPLPTAQTYTPPDAP